MKESNIGAISLYRINGTQNIVANSFEEAISLYKEHLQHTFSDDLRSIILEDDNVLIKVNE